MKLYFVVDYNNYYNRTYKKESTLAEYIQGRTYYKIDAINWTPGDGVDTVQVVNLPSVTSTAPNYLVTSLDDVNIDSRWFVMDSIRERGGQWRIFLHRDVVVDAGTALNTSPIFVQKGFVPDTDPFIYNQEGMTFNQIKKAEYELKDGSGVAWLVGYIDRKYDGGEELTLYSNTDLVYEGSYNEWPVKSFLNPTDYRIGSQSVAGNGQLNPTNTYLNFYYTILDSIGQTPSTYYTLSYSCASMQWTASSSSSKPTNISDIWTVVRDSGTTAGVINSDIQNYIKSRVSVNACLEALKSLRGVTDDSISNYNSLNGLNNKYVSFSNDLSTDINEYLGVYKITTSADNITRTSTSTGADLVNYCSLSGTSQYEYVKTIGATYKDYCKARAESGGLVVGIVSSDSGGSLGVYAPYGLLRRKLTLSASTAADYHMTLPSANSRNNLEDAPYDMFCIPYAVDGITSVTNNGYASFSNLQISADIAMKIAQGLGKELDANLYDLQLVPYCPYQSGGGGTVVGNVHPFTFTAVSGADFTIVYSGTTPAGLVLWCKKSSWSKSISIPSNATLGTVITDKKIQSNTDFHRLVSPNGAGTFEFNVAKNDGLSSIIVNFTYLPYSPYISLHPAWSGIYDQQATSPTKDFRALVCGGDYSISYMSDAWELYKTTNKNYENIFNREIETMDAARGYQRTQEWIGAVTGSVSSSASASLMGGWIGAIVGGVAGLGGGIADAVTSESIYGLQKQLKVDNFNANLDNVMALPQTITKTTGYNANNKYFPILEFYSCSSEEKTALTNKILWDGMTIGRIGTINEFSNYTYQTAKQMFRGELIKFIGDEDNHFTNALNKELQQGVYI